MRAAKFSDVPAEIHHCRSNGARRDRAQIMTTAYQLVTDGRSVTRELTCLWPEIDPPPIAHICEQCIDTADLRPTNNRRVQLCTMSGVMAARKNLTHNTSVAVSGSECQWLAGNHGH